MRVCVFWLLRYRRGRRREGGSWVGVWMSEVSRLLLGAEEILSGEDETKSVELGKAILLAAQCGDEADAGRAVCALAQKLLAPHPVVTER